MLDRLGLNLAGVQPRRIALRPQQFGRSRPRRAVTALDLRELLSLLGAVQLDAVNVLVRSHYLPLYSRLGRYRTELLDRLVYQDRLAFEYWGHAASILPVELHPALRWRMARHAEGPQWRGFGGRPGRGGAGYPPP